MIQVIFVEEEDGKQKLFTLDGKLIVEINVQGQKSPEGSAPDVQINKKQEAKNGK